MAEQQNNTGRDDEELYLLAEEEEEQVVEALQEYVETLTGDEAIDFTTKLANPSFHNKITDLIKEMAKLIAGAAVHADLEFTKLRKLTLGHVRDDTPEMHKMRTYYLMRRHSVDMSNFLRTEADQERFKTRLNDFYNDFKDLTCYK